MTIKLRSDGLPDRRYKYPVRVGHELVPVSCLVSANLKAKAMANAKKRGTSLSAELRRALRHTYGEYVYGEYVL